MNTETNGTEEQEQIMIKTNGTEEQEQMNDTETNGKRQTERKERKK